MQIFKSLKLRCDAGKEKKRDGETTITRPQFLQVCSRAVSRFYIFRLSLKPPL